MSDPTLKSLTDVLIWTCFKAKRLTCFNRQDKTLEEKEVFFNDRTQQWRIDHLRKDGGYHISAMEEEDFEGEKIYLKGVPISYEEAVSSKGEVIRLNLETGEAVYIPGDESTDSLGGFAFLQPT